MKKKSLVVVLLIFAVMTIQAQSKKDLQKDFDECTRTKDSIQNLLTVRTASLESINKKYQPTKDSLIALKIENINLKATIEKMAIMKDDNSLVIYDLKQLKDLLDQKIITQEEFNAKKTKLLEKLEE